MRNPDPGRDVEHAADPDRRVDRQAAERVRGEAGLPLQNVVAEDHRPVQVLHEVMHRLAHRRRDRGAVGLRGRHQHILVDHLIEGEDRAVGVLERIVEAVARRGAGSCAAGEGQPGGQQTRDDKVGAAQRHRRASHVIAVSDSGAG